MKNALNKKLMRDMRQSAMQILSIIVLCSLGTFLFAGLDGSAQTSQATIDQYFEENELADFWVSLPGADRASLERIRQIDGVKDVCARASFDMESTLAGDPTLNITAYDGPMDINVPIVKEGEALAFNDTKGCLVQVGFADANNLAVGERITVEYGGMEYSFIIKGTVYSPEYICVMDGITPNPKKYGFLLINARSIAELPLTQIVVKLNDGADSNAIQTAIETALPEAFVINRGSHLSTAQAQNNASMFKGLTWVFPILAYAVAALIVMTTLTRMIDNQRMQIGTLSALGYSSHQIRMHYLAYAIWPSLIGSLFGVIIGHLTLPSIVWKLVIGQNEYPYRVQPPISLPAWGMVLLTVLMCVLISLVTYGKNANETTAELLRPRPPKAGKRIFLERIKSLWTRFSFNTKMVVRNLMRNRMRTVMSLVGVMCCNILIIASFGLQDSINALAVNHYSKVLSYDVRANLSTDAGAADAYRSRLDADRVESIMEKSVSIRAAQTNRTSLMTVVEDDQQLLYLGENDSFVQIVSGSVAVTEKLSRTLHVKIGDTLELWLPGDEDAMTVSVGQIVHNNISQGIYMNKSMWEGFRKGPFIPTALELENPSQECIDQLKRMDEVDSINWPVDQIDDLLNMLDMLSTIFAAITLIALALAFVICYNMGLMNFAERTREYATLKVLGYHQKEIRGLILRENNLITALGVLLGIVPGIGLTTIVLKVCESEATGYPSFTSTQSVVLACIITYLFSLLIQLVLTQKVKKIVMVEALKSVE